MPKTEIVLHDGMWCIGHYKATGQFLIHTNDELEEKEEYPTKELAELRLDFLIRHGKDKVQNKRKPRRGPKPAADPGVMITAYIKESALENLIYAAKLNEMAGLYASSHNKIIAEMVNEKWSSKEGRLTPVEMPKERRELYNILRRAAASLEKSDNKPEEVLKMCLEDIEKLKVS